MLSFRAGTLFLILLFCSVSVLAFTPPGQRCEIVVAKDLSPEWPDKLLETSNKVFSFGDDVHSSSDGAAWASIGAAPIGAYATARDSWDNLMVSGIYSNQSRVFWSGDQGQHWGAIYSSDTPPGGSVYGTKYNISIIDNALYRWGESTSDTNVLYHYLEGLNWEVLYSFPAGTKIFDFRKLGSTNAIFTVVEQGAVSRLFAWQYGQMIPVGGWSAGEQFRSRLVEFDNNLFAITWRTDYSKGDIWRSMDGGMTWASVKTISGGSRIPMDISAAPKNGIFVSTNGGGVWHSWNGTDWHEIVLEGGIYARDLVSLVHAPHYTIVNGFEEILRIGCNAVPIPVLAQKTFNVQVGTRVNFNASASVDFESDSLQFSWTKQSGPVGELDNSSNPTPGFTPTVAGTYVFKVQIMDSGTPILGGEWIGEDTVTVTASLAEPENRSPIVEVDPTYSCTKNVSCHLAASVGDLDGDTVTVLWSRISGPTINWTQNNFPSGSFTPTVSGTYVIECRATDSHGASGADTTTVTVSDQNQQSPPSDQNNQLPPDQNAEPVVRIIEPNVEGEIGKIVALNATVSNPIGGPFVFSWRQLSGRPVQLTGADLPNPTFVAPESGTYLFEVTATNAAGKKSEPKRVAVEIKSEEGSAPTEPGPGLPGPIIDPVTVIAALLVVILVAAGIFFYWKQTKKPV